MRQAGLAKIDGGARPFRHGHQMQLLGDRGQQPAAVRADAQIVHRRGTVLEVPAGAGDLDRQGSPAVLQIEPVEPVIGEDEGRSIGGELRRAGDLAGGNDARRTAGGREGHQAGGAHQIELHIEIEPRLLWRADGENGPAVRREHRVAVESRQIADPGRRRTAIRRRAPHRPAARLAPGDEGQAPAIGAPARLKGRVGAGGERVRIAADERHQPQPPQRRKGQGPSIGGNGWPHDQPRAHRAAILADVLTRRWSDRLVDMGSEGDRRGDARRQVDALHAAVPTEHYAAPVGGEGVAWLEVLPGQGLNQVMGDGEGDAAVLAGGKVAQPKFRLALHMFGVGEQAPVGRQGRPEGCAGIQRLARPLRPGDHRDLFAGRQVTADDGPFVQVVQRRGAEVAGGVESAPVRRDHRAQGAAPLVAGRGGAVAGRNDQLARAAAGRVSPQLVALQVGAEAADVDRISRRRPGRRDHGRIVVTRGELPRTAAIGVHHPQIVRPRAVAHQGDAAAVARVGRLGVEGHTGGERPRHAAASRRLIEVAEEVEDQSLAVRRGVQGHPGPLVGVE